MTTSQKDGVFHAVTAFCEENSIPFEEGTKVTFDKNQRATIIGMLVEATNAGELEVKSDKARADLNKYWNGTLSNWLRRDPRLNGGVPASETTKNPGSRAGQGDKQLKNLKLLLKKKQAEGNEAHITLVEQAIEARMTAIQAEKVKDIEIDFSLLPADLVESIS